MGLRQQHGHVLGISTNITSSELLTYTNKVRIKQGLKPLANNDALSKAASEKASYMFAKDFWAHDGPDGTTPWVFIKDENYDYTYAGENLARGFSTSYEVVDAWMASSSHKENMLSPSYNDVGFAIAHGKLLGEETTLVVEMFGNTDPVQVAQAQTEEPKFAKTSSAGSVFATTDSLLKQAYKQTPIIDRRSTFQIASIILLVLFVGVFVIDMIIIERRKIVRHVGHNIDHVLFLCLIIVVIILLGRGLIL